MTDGTKIESTQERTKTEPRPEGSAIPTQSSIAATKTGPTRASAADQGVRPHKSSQAAKIFRSSSAELAALLYGYTFKMLHIYAAHTLLTR